jgi:hypothetical protein
VKIVLLTLSEMNEIINKKPENFGENNEGYKYDVIFLLEPLTAKEAIKGFLPMKGVIKYTKGQRSYIFQDEKKNIAEVVYLKLPERQYIKIYQ